ncbi:MAG: sigma-70 family RNA polymerase sigma factor [Myxococcales bacterium]
MEHDLLVTAFENNRAHLRGVAYRMLGSLSEAEDAVQETWLRLSRAETGDVANLAGWLTTVTARICLDMLRSRKARREDSLEAPSAHGAAPFPATSPDPESETMMADSVGLALLVVLETLAPPERLAFVLHDMFAVPFEEIAQIVGRSLDATRQLASRARRRVQGAPRGSAEDLAQHREVVGAFLTALRGGDFQGLLAVLHPDVEVHADAASMPGGVASDLRGAREAAAQAIALARGARAARPALIDGSVGLVVAPQGHLLRVLRFTLEAGKIVRLEVLGDPAELARLELSMLPD